MADEKKSGKGFANMPPEQAAAIRKKGRETRLRNQKLRETNRGKADELRKEADVLIEKAEALREKADIIDGDSSSEKNKKKAEAKLSNEIEVMYRDSVSAQYLKIMKQHAILRGLSAAQLVTPTHIAMDILVNPNATVREKQEAAKTLQNFENSKPATTEDTDDGGLGNVEEEMNNVLAKVKMSAPKR